MPIVFSYDEDERYGYEHSGELYQFGRNSCLLGVKPATLRSWIKDPNNVVPAHKIGRMWKFKRSELDAWVNSGKSAIND